MLFFVGKRKSYLSLRHPSMSAVGILPSGAGKSPNESSSPATHREACHWIGRSWSSHMNPVSLPSRGEKPPEVADYQNAYHTI